MAGTTGTATAIARDIMVAARDGGHGGAAAGRARIFVDRLRAAHLVLPVMPPDR